MSLRQYLILVSIGTLIGFATLIVVLFAVNPNEAGLLGFLLFYLSLSVTLIGAVSLVGFGIRMILYRHENIILREVTAAFRQACFFSIIVIASLILARENLLTWWNALILILILTVLEFFLVSMSARTPREPV